MIDPEKYVAKRADAPKAARPAVNESRFMSSVLDSLSAHIAVLDEHGDIIAVNKAWRQFASVNDGDLQGFNIGDNYLRVCSNATGDCGSDARAMSQGISDVISGTYPDFYMQYACHTPSGPGWYQVRVRELEEFGVARCFVVSHENITESKLAEEELRTHQAQLAHVVRLGTLGELAGGIAHELNQPLTAIANFASGCARRVDAGTMENEELRVKLEQIAGESHRAAQIIARLRKLVGRGDVKMAPIDVRRATEEVASLLKGEASRLGVALSLLAEPGLPDIFGDTVQIQQVIMNLLRNAIEASAEANPTAPGVGEAVLKGEVSVRLGMLDPQTVCLDVRDNGHGISGDPESVFKPFVTSKADGLGLGLSLARSIMSAHSGSLSVHKTGGDGTVMRMTVPILRDEEPITISNDTPI